MSAVTGSTPGGVKRSLAELLAGRASKAARRSEYSRRRGQEAAVYLLSCHQDVNGFLLEAEDPPGKENSDSKPSPKSSRLPPSFIGSTIRDQASHLGVPDDVLGARSAVSNIQQLCHAPGNNMEEAWLSQDQRDRLTAFLKTLKVLMKENCFRRSVFLKEIWEQPRPPVLEVVWHLHSMDIVGIEDILESCTDTGRAGDWFCTGMRALCLHMENSSSDAEFLEQIISDLVAVLIGKAFCQPASSVKNSEQSKVSKISLSILDVMLSWLLDGVVEAGSGQSYKPGVERHWLLAYEVSRYRARVIPDSLEEFFLHTLSHTLTYKPKLKVSDAIRFQGNWSFVKTCPLLMELFRKVFVLLSAEKLTSHVQNILDTQEVNWYHILSFFSCLVVCQSEAQHLVRDLLSRLLSQAFETYELEYLITAFLIARQAALEGPAAFTSYTDWFKGTFGSSSSHQSSSKKSLVFLLKFLSDLVPFEAPQYLKVHILHSPFVPTKFRSLLMEYITLAKTRLADMKVSIEDMGLYEDLSVGSDKDQTQSQAQQDVEKAVKIFQNTGKIPASVMEASIFRRPYFTLRFLPALLTPRVLPKNPDSLLLLIDSLKRADKIPANMLSSYFNACELEKHRKLEGNEKMDVSMNEEPVARLQAALWELRPYVMDGKRYDEISSQVAVISDRLTAVMGSGDPNPVPGTSEALFSRNIEELEPQELTVSDLLLTSFCQCVMAASSTNPPDRQGPWPSLYVKMLFGHRRALFALLSRILQLLCHQSPLLKDSHVVGLAAFSVHLHECRMSLVPPGSDASSLDKFWEVLLNPQCSGSLPVVLRFCTAAVSYACCRLSLLSLETPSDSIPPLFMRKVQHLLPRLVLETRREGIMEEETDTPVVFGALSLPSAEWKEAARSLWRQTRVQELFRKDLFQLSFRDWLLWEMSMTPDVDPLSDLERQDYQRWAVSQCFLPESSALDGCGNHLEKACSAIVDAVLDFSTGSELVPGSAPSEGRTGLGDILSRLQELVCDLLLSRSGKNIQVNFLLDVFHGRLSKISDKMETGAQLRRQSQLSMCCRIILGLPSSLLIRPHTDDRGFTSLKSDDFFQFVSKHLKNMSQRGSALPYDLTAHFFRGLLSSGAQCEDPEEAVNSVLAAAYTQCPIVMTSAAMWWPQLDAAVGCQWKCLYEADLPQEIERLREMQGAVDRFLSQGSAFPLTGAVWLSAAFLHFSIRRNKVQQKRLPALLGSLSAKSLQEGAEHTMALEYCIQIIQCLEERGGDWLTTFQLKSEKHKCSLHQSVSEEFLKLLPLAFFSLATSLPGGIALSREEFLPVSLEMYTQIFQLFLDGSPLLHPPQNDPQTIFSRGRQFLLSCILKGQHPSAAFRSRLPQIVIWWEEKDPELAGLLRNVVQSEEEDCMYDEPDLF
ncbi:Fanconi anemia group A protein isoform X2 [Rana temporaria]|uniref:Fanconi anemia group A protein isoform X2 n=1 Tax=Rana temporaria TaxID=8407 RepID=UPI001AAC9BB5|nr:Fanconi anemia group A protein isoform X2 [Rana temporaria]